MGNVYMEAEQVRFKDSTYHNLQTAVTAALEGGGGGGTTVIANPEGSATADLAKLQVGTTIYGIPAEAGDISYDNTSSGMTADDVQEAIDELNTGLSGVSDLIPSDATSSNKLATADDIPDAVTGNPAETATAGDLTKLQIGSDIYSIPSGGGAVYSDSETTIGTWLGAPLYRKVVSCGALPNNTEKYTSSGISGAITLRNFYGVAYQASTGACLPLPYVSDTDQYSLVMTFTGSTDTTHPNSVRFYTNANLANFDASYVVLEYTKNS